MLSQTSKIAIRAVIYLSEQSINNKKASVDEISDEINASRHTVGKALQKLVKSNVIDSLKGPNGGFFLDDSQQNQVVYKVIEAIEGTDLFTRCGLGLVQCSDKHPCPIHEEYKEVRDAIQKVFTKRKIKDLRNYVSKGYAFLVD